ncbi:MAG: PDZ domain-containing protein, partial [Chlamydiia bacterium]|nr:PDZ domain-containing protein [Chlamydiia bacterium]
AHSLAELKARHYNRFVEFISFQLKEIAIDDPTKGTKIIHLCEKQLCYMENEYLGLDDQNHPLNSKEQEHLIVSRTLKALANSLDAHTAYYSPDEAYAMKVQLEKGMCGIGVVLREGIDGIVIQDMIAGGPAEKSGKILKGDAIVEVDGQSVKEYSFQRVLEIMKGKEGTQTTLGIQRKQQGGGGEFVQVELTRAKIILADQRVDISSEPYGDGIIGKITLHSFYEGEDGISSEKDLKRAIDQLREEGKLCGLVLDMRENSGGFLSQSVKVTGLFISSGVVVISKYSDESMKYYRAVDGERYYDGPLVVLISRGSASATEIVAQALQDYGVAVVVGDEQTYGKGTIQHQTITSDGPPSFFKVTIGRYYTVSGRSTQIDGVKSDIVVPSAMNFGEIGEAYLEYPLPA